MWWLSTWNETRVIKELNSFLILINLNYNFKELHMASGRCTERRGYRVVLLSSLFSSHLRSLWYLFLIYVHVCVCVHVGRGEWRMLWCAYKNSVELPVDVVNSQIFQTPNDRASSYTSRKTFTWKKQKMHGVQELKQEFYRILLLYIFCTFLS